MVNVGILGATGMVGQRFIQLLDNHPDFELTALAASSRSAGKKYEDAATWYLDSAMPDSVKDIVVTETDPNAVSSDVEIFFSALPADNAKVVEPKFAEKFVIASNASAMRMEKDVPLVVPEINPEFLDVIEIQQKNRGWEGFIVTNPNCCAIPLSLTLKPILNKYEINRVYVSTMQAVSGAGYNGVPSMAIVDNLVPYIAEEEEKLEEETLHLLGTRNGLDVTPAKFGMTSSCHRVAVVDGHTEAVFVELNQDVAIDDIKNDMANFKSVPQELGLYSAPKNPIIVKEEDNRPQPRMDRNNDNGMAVTVGRIRKDPTFENSFKYVLLGHNTVRGAAGASILNAELINKTIL